MDNMYSSCNEQHASFKGVAECTATALRADSRYSFHNGYISNANRVIAALDVLEERIASGRISEKEARYQVQELLAQMHAQVVAEVNSINAATQRGQGVQTRCTTVGTRTNCTSY